MGYTGWSTCIWPSRTSCFTPTRISHMVQLLTLYVIFLISPFNTRRKNIKRGSVLFDTCSLSKDNLKCSVSLQTKAQDKVDVQKLASSNEEIIKILTVMDDVSHDTQLKRPRGLPTL